MPANKIKVINEKKLRSYVKCKRTKNIIKKSLEVSIQCDIDIIIIIVDKNKNQIKQTVTNPLVTMESITKMMDEKKDSTDKKIQKTWVQTKVAKDIIKLGANDIDKEDSMDKFTTQSSDKDSETTSPKAKPQKKQEQAKIPNLKRQKT